MRNSELLNTSLSVAQDSLRVFSKKLDLDTEYLQGIFAIPVILKENMGNNAALYDPVEGKIYISLEWLDEISLNAMDRKYNKSKLVANVATVLVHEYLHAIRTVIYVNGFTLLDNNLIEQERKRLIQEKNGHDLTQYRMFLSDMLDRDYVKNFLYYIPIKVQKLKDYQYKVIVYDRQNKKFGVIENYNFKNNSQDILKSIGESLNKNKVVFDEIVYPCIRNEESSPVLCANCHYQYNGRLLEVKELASVKSIQELDDKLNQKEWQLQSYFDQQNALEEVLTQVVAYIVILSRKENSLNINNIIHKISAYVDYDEQLVLKVLEHEQENLLNWFMSGLWNPYYENYLEKIFGEDYNLFLKYISRLYVNGNVQEIAIEDTKEKADTLVRKIYKKEN